MRPVRRGINIAGETVQAKNFRRQIMGGKGAPGAIGRSIAGGDPQRLSLVAIGCGPGVKSIRDDTRPIDAGNLRREIGHGGG